MRTETDRRSIARAAALVLACALGVPVVAAAPAARASTITACATPVTYEACGRVFPDPQAGLPLDPNAEGGIAAGDFIQFGTPGEGSSEIWDGLRFLQSRYDRWLEVWTLEDLLDEPDARSAGLWLGGRRQRLPLIMARVTDESVPADRKRRFVFGLSLHGIERAGVEGGTRALEDLVTYAYCESLGPLTAAEADAACAAQTQVRRGAFAEGEGGFPVRLLPWDPDSLTMGETLKHAELYFTYNNPDGWHRGDKGSFGGVGHYQRYNGNGVDPNRDWPVPGYTYEPYTPSSEPETVYFARALRERGGHWASGIDLHGMTYAPVLTYTMLPAGQHDYRKNARIRAIAERTQVDGQHRLLWSPLIDDGSGTKPQVPLPFLGPVMPMGPQQWGTVWDTIDYTITGSYGDWIDNPDTGLGAIGMDNEMALSHITNCGIGTCFLPDVEQLHVAGNKGLIYADIDTTLRTESIDYRFPFRGRGAYVVHGKERSHPGGARTAATAGLEPQAGFDGLVPCSGLPPAAAACTSEEFDVGGPREGIANGGIRVDIGHVGTHTTNDEIGGDFILQRLATDHGGREWVDIADNYTGGQAYLPNGATITANDPVPGRYRIWMRPTTSGPYTFEVRFTGRRAHADLRQRAYRASNLEFFEELNRFLAPRNRFEPAKAGSIIEDAHALDGIDVLVLADDALPGWNEATPARSARTKAEHDTYYDRLRSFARAGGTIVLTDSALRALADLTGKDALAASRTLAFAGYVGFNDGEGTTYDDPLAEGIDVEGAAEGSGNRHQTYEPVPLGFAVEDGFPPSERTRAPVWGIPQQAFLTAGGRVAGRSGAAGVTLGELATGKGSIRFVGALLPTPSEDSLHPFGLASYALTWTGWQLFENLVAVTPDRTPAASKVLGDRTLPRTGLEPGIIVFLVALAGAAIAARRLRDVGWL